MTRSSLHALQVAVTRSAGLEIEQAHVYAVIGREAKQDETLESLSSVVSTVKFPRKVVAVASINVGAKARS